MIAYQTSAKRVSYFGGLSSELSFARFPAGNGIHGSGMTRGLPIPDGTEDLLAEVRCSMKYK